MLYMESLGKINELEQEQMPDVDGSGSHGSPSNTNLPSSTTSSTPNVPTRSTGGVSKNVPNSVAQHENVIKNQSDDA